jgi:hypothetical protein
MKRFQPKFHLIAGLLAVCCLIGVGSRSAQAQSHTFQTGDVFVGVTTGFDNSSTGKVLWYRNDGTFVTTLDTGQTNTETTGLGFDASGNLYATVFEANNIVKFDHSGALLGFFGSGYNVHPESILFDSVGNAYVGQADGSMQVLKFTSTGAPAGTFMPAPQNRGTDWIDLAADQKTLFYTSEGNLVKRFDLSTSTQLADFNSLVLPGAAAYALRVLPDGGVLVADTDRVLLLDSSGNVARTYCARLTDFCSSPFPLEPGNSNPQIFGLTLDPDGKSFWTADYSAGTVWKVDIATGTIDLAINTGFAFQGGLVVFHEITSSNSRDLVFNPSPTPVTQIATIGNPTDPSAQSLALTLTSVTNAINVSVTFFYELTDVSTGKSGVGIGDGICEVSQGATEANDVDCRLAGNFSYPNPILPPADKLVPHIVPSHNNLGVWVRVIATRVSDGQPAVEGVDYTGPVRWYYAWNTNPALVPPNIGTNPYVAGWNNQNPQMYDRPGENLDIAFVNNITTFSKFNCNPTCVGTADPGTGGITGKLNDIVVAVPPNPPVGVAADTVDLLLPAPAISPFPYASGFPMLVAFQLEKGNTEIPDTSALTLPHSVNVATLQTKSDGTVVNIPVQFPKGFPTTFAYNSFAKAYYIFLSPAPYTADGKTVYTLQINSDLFSKPITASFVVKKYQFQF